MKTINQHIFSLSLFIFLAYGISWIIWHIGFAQLNIKTLDDEQFGLYLFLGSFGPTLSAIIVTFLKNGKTAVVELLKRVVQIQVRWGVYLFVFLALPALGILLFHFAGIQSKIPLWQIGLTMLPLAPLNALVGGIIFGNGPLGEEMGWRGIMQEMLGHTLKPLWGAIIIGIAWSAWHIPLFRFADFRAGLDLASFVPLYTLSLILITFTMGHLWNWSGGSLFVAIFFHAMINITATKLTDSDWWNFDKLSNLNIYLLVLIVFALTAILAEVLNRAQIFHNK